MNTIADCSMEQAVTVAKAMASHPNICSRKWVFNQYDSMVGTINQTTNAPSDAAVVKVKGTDKSIAMSVDCNSRYIYADPFKGAMIAVSEAARNIVCSGGDPAAVTNCLNFGNPYNTEVYWQFVNAIKGMGEACKKFDTPVTGGNVSFYNQSSDNDAVFPTPTIGMVGLILDGKKHMTLDFKQAGDVIYMIGQSRNDIGSSQYLVSQHKVEKSPAPHFELDEEYNVHQAVKAVIAGNHIQSAHDLSEGGLFIALLESAMVRNHGFSINKTQNIKRNDAYLFGEAQSRVVVSVKAADVAAFEKALGSTPFEKLGEVTSGVISVDGTAFGSVAEYKNLFDNALANYLA